MSHLSRVFWVGAVIAGLFGGWAVAAAPEGLPSGATGELMHFTIPERNRDGVLIWQLKGERAKIRPDGQMEIERLIVSTYRDAKMDWVLTTPACILNRETREAVSESDVSITNNQTLITGTGFYWVAKESRFIIRSRVQVTIPGGLVKGKIL